MKLANLVLVYLYCTAFSFAADCELPGSYTDMWPAIPVADLSRATNAIVEYHRQNWDWRTFAATGPYRRGGDYMNWAKSVWSPIRWNTTTNDANGVILQTYDNGKTYVFQPVTTAQYALWMWSDHVSGQPLSPLFRTNTEALLSMQRDDGALPFNFDLLNWNPPLKSGWVSGMAQGLAASVFVRAYKEFGDERYKEAARKACSFMLTPARDKGCLGTLADLDPSLERFVMIQEYPHTPDTYTLNGSIFALFGLYDCLEYDPSLECMFARLVQTICFVLPYYDYSGTSTYDLSHLHGKPPTPSDAYHAFNTMLVWALDSVAPRPELNRTWQTWASYVSQPLPSPVRLTASRVGDSIIVSGLSNGVNLQGTADFRTWRDIPVASGAYSVEISNTNHLGFFRIHE